MVEFKLFGIPVRVEPIFWITLAILGFIGADVRTSEGVLEVALFVLAGFLSILIHEMGHALMIRKFGLPTQVVLSSFGGYALYPAGVLSRLKSFIVTAAGPGLQIIAGVGLYFSLGFVDLPDTNLNTFLGTFIGISIFWAILNLLPIYPLDGGQMLGSILGPKRQAGLHLTSMIVAAVIAVVALYFREPIGVIFMGMFAYQNYQHWQRTK